MLRVYKNFEGHKKISKKMTADVSKSYLRDLNKLVDEYNNGYHRSIDTKPVNADYSA